MRVLIVGNIFNIHICRLISHMNRLSPNLEIDIFNTVESGSDLPKETRFFSAVFHRKRHFPGWMYKIPGLYFILFRIIDTCLSFSKELKGRKYNLINIHFITLESFFLMPVYKRRSRIIMSSPWGSDMYRKKGINKYFTKKVLDWSNFVSAPKIQFREDIKTLYNVPESKFVDLGFGADAIDKISQSTETTRDVAKQKLNISGYYTITVGYNGTSSQNHLKIINAIQQIREDLPERLLILLPMTYGASDAYISEVKELVKKHRFEYKIFDKFLTDEELVNLRKSSDMFIHAQPSDAFSASMQEYILSDTIIVNGKWTRYPDFEKFGAPYYIFNSFEELPECIVKAYKNEDDIFISDKLKEFVMRKGWLFLANEWERVYSSFGIKN